jgi:hypothetical protein
MLSIFPQVGTDFHTSEGSNGQFLTIFQGAVKLLHQVGELFGVFFLNDGVSEVLPRFSGVAAQITLPAQTPAAVSQSPSV